MSARAPAWAFLFPTLHGGGRGTALGASGAVATISGDAEIRQAILLLLSTAPGERVMRPRYGCHLERLVWLPNDDTTAGLAIHYVRQAIERFEPRVEIVALDAGAHPDEADALEIALTYRVRASRASGELRLAVDLAGGASDRDRLDRLDREGTT